MSSCTFVIVKDHKAKYCVEHYSVISSLLQGKTDPKYISEISLYTNDSGYLHGYSDTDFMPSVIINFDNKTLINTSYNWFDDFEKYLTKGWKFKEFRPEICESCKYMLCPFHNKPNCEQLKEKARSKNG